MYPSLVGFITVISSDSIEYDVGFGFTLFSQSPPFGSYVISYSINSHSALIVISPVVPCGITFGFSGVVSPSSVQPIGVYPSLSGFTTVISGVSIVYVSGFGFTPFGHSPLFVSYVMLYSTIS